MKKYLFLLLLISACTNAKPELEEPGFEPPTLDQSGYNINSPYTAITVSGKCSDIISNIEVSFDSGANWKPVSSVGVNPQISCTSGGTFSWQFDFSSSQTQYYISFVPGESATKTFWVRGMTTIGGTTKAEGRIIYDGSGATATRRHISALSGDAVYHNVGSYKYANRLGMWNASSHSLDSSNFVLKTSLASEDQ